MKRLKIIISALTLLFTLSFGSIYAAEVGAGANEGDMAVVESRMFNSLKRGAPVAGEVSSLIASITAEGGFKGIDYQDEEFNSGDRKRAHLQNTTRLAKAYVDTEGKYYQSEELYKSIESLMDFWVKSDLDDVNWWHRAIGFPKDLMPAVVLMRGALMERNLSLYKRLVSYLGYSWEGTPPRFKTGANGTDIGKITFAKAMLSGDEELMGDVMSFVGSLIFIAQGGVEEGIYPDYSFSQHSANGRQLYLGTYGREYLDGVLFFMEYTNGTGFALEGEKVSLIENLVLNGVAWMWYRGQLDPNQCGRKIYDKENFALSFIPITKRIIALNTPQCEALKGVLEMMDGKQELRGTRSYPYHDYQIHRGEGYMSSVRMTSTRTVGNEAGNGQGLENYHTGDGATYFRVTGDEYSSIFSKWSWREIPGTTVVLDDKPMPQPMWGKGGKGGDDYAGVVSTGESGVAGFIFRKDEAIAHKAYFNTPTATIALGAGISTARDDAPMVTTINQTLLKGEVKQREGEVWHNMIGYRLLDEQSIEVDEDKKSSILKLTIEHGLSPQNSSYAYAVYPNITLEAFQALEPSVEILSNDTSIQAVRDVASGEVMAIFYEAGILNIDKRLSLSVDMAAVVICTPDGAGGYRVHVGNPLCEMGSVEGINITMNSGKKSLKTELLTE